MAWILQAIKNVSMKANIEVLRNSVSKNKDLLEQVKASWIEDQRKYFEKNTSKRKANAEAQERFTYRFFAMAMLLVLGLFIMKAVMLVQQGFEGDILDMTDIKDWKLYSVFLVSIDTFIAIGAARSVYVEKKGFNEEAKQFQRMRDLFERGSKVMADCLEKDDLNGAERLLVELGREALTENGDWLLLRRSKPMEVPLG